MTVCGTGGWVGPKPGDPDNNVLLSATPAFGGIDVSWTYPKVNSHAVAHIILYRGFIPEFVGAIYHGTVTGNMFYDRTTASTIIEYFYWIQIVSVNGTVGELIGPASAVARPTIEQTLEMLTGQIDAGMLAQELKLELGNISLLGNDITQEVKDRMTANLALGETIAGLEGQVTNAITIVDSEINKRITADSAIVTSLDSMAVGFNESIAGLAEEVILKTGPTSALAQKITTLEATVDGDTVTGQIGLTTEVDTVTNTVAGLYTAKIDVNGLVGGFGLANDGATVEAGFDVDRFWVGRTNTDKRKPFIIENGEVFINKAAIADASITAAKIDSISLIGPNKFNVKGSNTSNTYMQINSRSIKVYENGILRVHIGDLSDTGV